MTEIKEKEFVQDFRFRLTKGKTRASWQAWHKDEHGFWRPLRAAETTFESAQMAIFDEMVMKAFPR